MGKDTVLICRSVSTTDSESVFGVIYSTETGNFYLGCSVFSKHKDSVQKTGVCLCITRLPSEKAIVSCSLSFSFFLNLKLTWSGIFKNYLWINLKKTNKPCSLNITGHGSRKDKMFEYTH